MRRAFTLALALLIAVTSQQMAMARAVAMDANGQVILCTGHGPVAVTVNSQGEPVEHVHICPDCALSLMAIAEAPVPTPPWVIHTSTLAQTVVQASEITTAPRATKARAPPALI